MKLLLNAGFGYPLGLDLEVIRFLGFDGIRQDIRRATEAQPLIDELARAQMFAVLLLGPEVWADPERASWVAASARLPPDRCG